MTPPYEAETTPPQESTDALSLAQGELTPNEFARLKEIIWKLQNPHEISSPTRANAFATELQNFMNGPFFRPDGTAKMQHCWLWGPPQTLEATSDHQTTWKAESSSEQVPITAKRDLVALIDVYSKYLRSLNFSLPNAQ